MTVKKDNKPVNFKNICFYGVVIVAIIAIGYYLLNPKQQNKVSSNNAVNTLSAVNENSDASTANVVQQTPVQEAISPEPQNETQTKQSTAEPKSTPKTNEQDKSQNKAASPIPPANNANEGIKIVKKEVSEVAKFYPYKSDDGTNMEVIAVKASDGTIRTALNTCQVCYDSGKGYYVQVGSFLVCQNCRNKFSIDQVDVVKGGCNPVPILEKDKIDKDDSIIITKDFLESQKQYFSKWGKQ